MSGYQMKHKMQGAPYLTILLLVFYLLLTFGCSPSAVAVRELTYHPSPDDPYRLWGGYVTDSGLLFLCGSVDNGREGVKRVDRVYNLELRLEGTLAPLRSDAIQTIIVDEHPSLQMSKGYLSDLCQFDKKRSTRKPDETGWVEIFMNPGEQGWQKLYYSDVIEGNLPAKPSKNRIALYEVRDTSPPKYLLMGRLQKDGQDQRVLLVLGGEHIEKLW